jgi:hypothetical protein
MKYKFNIAKLQKEYEAIANKEAIVKSIESKTD